ncbi:MAG: adenylate cyclase, partial [Gammaproteobacteria bacterium]|nr:adenylate cyclase [Gammaproteobacteria bacterium]
MSVRSSPRVELPITLDLDEGIDRHRLNQLRDRFCRLHAVRLARTRSALGMRQQRVLDLLPLIFHLNHPALPGFLDTTCPKGFRGYTPDTSSLQQAQCVARTFHWRPDKRLAPQLHALYLMGSTGSVAHSGASDLDVWLCHDPALKPAEVACLQRK